MNNFASGLFNFMRDRYGWDQLGRALGFSALALWAVALLVRPFMHFFGIWVAWLSTVINWIGLALLVYMGIRFLSKNKTKRAAENEAYLNWRHRKQDKEGASRKNVYSEEQNGDASGYAYLACSFCGQQMRVPKGKGKIAVRCPSCNEKTIFTS